MVYTGVDYFIFVKGNSVHNVSMIVTLMACASKWFIEWYLQWEFTENMTTCWVNKIPRVLKQVSRAWTSNYIPYHLWDIITCPCPLYLPLTQHSSYIAATMDMPAYGKPLIQNWDDLIKLLHLKFLHWFGLCDKCEQLVGHLGLPRNTALLFTLVYLWKSRLCDELDHWLTHATLTQLSWHMQRFEVV